MQNIFVVAMGKGGREWDGQVMRSYSTGVGTISNFLWQKKMEDNVRKFMYDWVILLQSRN